MIRSLRSRRPRPRPTGLAGVVAIVSFGLAGVFATAGPPRGLAEVDDLLAELGEIGLRLDAAAAERLEAGPGAAPTGIGGPDLAALAETWVESDASAEVRLERLERLRRLAESMSAEAAEPLRFALATARYLASAASADRWRSGTDAPRSPKMLAEEFAIAAEDFLRLAARAERERAATASLALRAGGVEADLLSEAQQRLEARRLRASFLAGWSVLQRGLLLGEAASAAEAAEILEPLLDAGRSDPGPEDISVDRRGDLGFAQTVLGYGIARGIGREGDEGERWIDLLAIDSVDPDLRAALPVWSLLMRTAGGEPAAARRLVEGWRRRRDADAGWFAVALLEALRRDEAEGGDAPRSEAWEGLARIAASGLIDLGREDRLRRLADGARSDGPWRPAGPLGAVLAALRELDDATGGDRVAASRALLAAADGWPSPAPGLRLDAIVGLLESGAITEAWAALETARERLATASAADRERAAWLRLVAIDRLRARGALAAAGLDRTAWALEASAFLEAHPESERASLVAVRLGGEDLSLDRLVELAASGAPGVRRSVRSTIARRLAEADAERREEVLAAWRRLGPIELERDPRAAGDAEVRREAYEAVAVLAAGEGEDLRRARRLLSTLDPEAPGGTAWERALALGLAADVALASGDPASARTMRQAALRADADRGRRAEERSAVATSASWLQRVGVGWRASRDAADRSRSLAEAWAALVLEAAEAVLADPRGDESDRGVATPPDLEVRAAALAAAGEAERHALRGIRTPEAAAAWRAAARRFADLAETEAGVAWRAEALQAVANSAAAAGGWDEVLAASRRLLAGLPRGNEAWRIAKALQIEALAELDPAQARAVLDQHRVLDPEWDRGGPGIRLRRLHERLPEAVP